MKLDDLRSKKIAILGLGVNNRGLAEYFKRENIQFEAFSDWQSPDELVGKIDEFDIIFRTPGLPHLSKAVQQAKRKGVVIYSQTKLFFDLCSCPIIGVTGTKGKGTTASLIFEILKRNFQTKIYLAGNIGQDPFEFLDKLTTNDWVVLELSSFQLQDLHKSPHLAVVLKITSEHLDHHRSVEEYIEAKKNIVRFQSASDLAVLNYDSEISRSFAEITEAEISWNSTEQEVKPGCYIKDEKIFLGTPHLSSPTGGEDLKEGGDVEIMKTDQVKLTGRFNLENITAAITAVAALGLDGVNLIKKVVSDFKGLEHRLEFVREVKGVKFFNDSASTNPETTIAAAHAFEQPLILIVGGSEKNADHTELARTMADSKIKALVPIGITGPKIAALARRAGYQGKIVEVKLSSMETIVLEANKLAEAGDIVLLSPASASFDMFANYKHRGELFKKFVGKL